MSLALSLGNQPRPLWMYDTFAGMTGPTDVDLDNTGTKASVLLDNAKRHEIPEDSLMLGFASLEDVRTNIGMTGYPSSLLKFIQGPVEQTIPANIPETIALLRIDTDWYESTRHELVHLYPRLSPGGVLIIDDYGHWQGARRAVDEYFGNCLFLNRIDYTARLIIKPLC